MSSDFPEPLAHPEPSRRRLKILVVDDEATVRRVITAYLKKDHDVHSADNGTHGLEQFRSGTWDVVLSDGNLGDMTGLDLAMAIKRSSPRTPVVLVTGSKFAVAAPAGGPCPFDAAIEKPFGQAALLSAIAAVCPE